MSIKAVITGGLGTVPSFLLTGGLGAYDVSPSCEIEPTGGFFWLFEDGSIMALEDCSGGWLLEDQSGQQVGARPAGGGGKRRRRRIRLDDGRILEPANDAAYRAAVEQIIANFGQASAEPPQAPKNARKRRFKGAVKSPSVVPKLAPVVTLPAEFYRTLDLHTEDVLNTRLLAEAWVAFLADREDEDEVELLLLS